MASHIIDSPLYAGGFATPELAAVFSDGNRVQKWLDVEAALAETQAELGMIPVTAAAEIRRKARAELLDLEALGAGIAETAHPLVPAVRALQALCEGDAGQYLHYGVTTQDVMDTGLMLQAKEGWAILLEDLRALRRALCEHARSHRHTVMVGRTHGQQALPITFGYKLAVWVDEIDRHLERCAEARERVFVGNVTGAVGTMASFGEHGFELQARTLGKLELGVPRICWHASRDRMVELACLLAQMAATAGKIAREIYNLQRAEIGELREPFRRGKVGSSTMPHKQNPANAELVVALSRLVRGNLLAVTDAAFHDHERDAACLRMELAALPEMFVYTGAALRRTCLVVEGMEARPERMRANADMLGGLLLSERVMLALGERIGKQDAHEVVYEAAMRCHEEGIAFRDALAADPRIAAQLDAATIEELLDPAQYVGLAAAIVDGVVGDAPRDEWS